MATFLDKLRAAFETKASAAGQLISMSLLGRPVWTPRQYDRLAQESYVENAIAFRAICEVTRSAACVPWVLFQQGRNGREEVTTSPLLDLLDRPNPMQGHSEFFEAMLAFYLIAGNSYVEAISVSGQPRELWTLRPDRMKVLPGRTGMPAGYVYEVGQKKRDWPADPNTGESPILHLKSFHPLNDFYGLAATEPAARSIDQRNASDAWNLSLLQNGARPSGALVVEAKDGRPGKLSDKQFTRLIEEIENQYSGTSNAGRPFLLEGGLKWQEMSLNPKDLDFIQGRNQASRDIALSYGVPPQLLGIPGDNTYSNYQEARLALWEETVVPLLRHLRDEFNNWLVPKFGERLTLDIDLDEIPALAPRRADKWEAVLKAVQAGVITPNEAREALGYDSIQGADVLLTKLDQMPMLADDAPSEDLATQMRGLGYGAGE